MSVGLVTIAYWIGASGLGIALSSVNLFAARSDHKYQVGRPERRRERVLYAKFNLAFEATRVVIFMLLFTAGLMVAFRTEFNPDPAPASLYVRVVILLAITVFLSQSFMQKLIRYLLNRPKG